jgi:hypothetical protein
VVMYPQQRAQLVDTTLDRGDGAQFAALTRALLGATTTTEVLALVVTATRRLVPGADLVSVTQHTTDGTLRTLARTDPVATELDEVQARAGRGPCLDAVRHGRVSTVDVGADTRWPEFAAAASRHGFAAVACAELVTHELSGTLNVYSCRPYGLTSTDVRVVALLASHGSLAVARTRVEAERAQLLQAVATRDVIGQAKGILMQRQGVTAAEAFDLLRRTSQDMNIKLVDLARTVADRHVEL